jgi:hypothetical protein
MHESDREGTLRSDAETTPKDGGTTAKEVLK